MSARALLTVLTGTAAVWSYVTLPPWSVYEVDPFTYLGRYVLVWVLVTVTACLLAPDAWPVMVLLSIALFVVVYVLVFG